ncbi:unnamed protein product [Parascedosporium putredinis]|uniref:Nephrocystin 3-like N-terminal domain-containing protein n=1 Tax=Parascedosporium putredinis TaxID=1442378 RepID=A0A9P1H147_9PEZI|nr:unnamed protein product [Parascedosporium putredinis]CAI7992418.1 unnamed protein product [Parascedosporium putredinis]
MANYQGTENGGMSRDYWNEAYENLDGEVKERLGELKKSFDHDTKNAIKKLENRISTAARYTTLTQIAENFIHLSITSKGRLQALAHASRRGLDDQTFAELSTIHAQSNTEKNTRRREKAGKAKVDLFSLCFMRQDLAEEKKWKFQFLNEACSVKELWTFALDKLGRLSKVARVGEPRDESAGKAWPFVVALEFAIQGENEIGSILIGIEKVASAMLRCTAYDSLLRELVGICGTGDAKNLAKAIESCLLSTYTRILKFFHEPALALSKSRPGLYGYTLWSLGDIIALENDLFLYEQAFFQRVTTSSVFSQRNVISRVTSLLSDVFGDDWSWVQGADVMVKLLGDMIRDNKTLEGSTYSPPSGRKFSTSWTLKTQQYARWEVAKAPSLLWVKGIAGAGKTILVSRIIDHHIALRKKDPLVNDFQLAYFYCKRDAKERRFSQAIFRSYIRQLSARHHPLPEALRRAFADNRKRNSPSSELTFEQYRQVLLELLRLSKAGTILVLDALDECIGHEQQAVDSSAELQQVLRMFKDLLNSGLPVRIIVSTRYTFEIKTGLWNRQQIEVTSDKSHQDILRMVKGAIKVYNAKAKKRTARGQPRDSILPDCEKRMLQVFDKRSQGNFQWAAMHIKYLVDGMLQGRFRGVGPMEAELGTLPQDLVEAYHGVCERIIMQSAKARDDACRVIRWLLALGGSCPVRVILAAVCQTLEGTDANPVKKRERYILTVCQNLVKVDGDVLRFSHSSAQEYCETYQTYLPIQRQKRAVENVREKSDELIEELWQFAISNWYRHFQWITNAEEKTSVANVVLAALASNAPCTGAAKLWLCRQAQLAARSSLRSNRGPEVILSLECWQPERNVFFGLDIVQSEQDSRSVAKYPPGQFCDHSKVQYHHLVPLFAPTELARATWVAATMPTKEPLQMLISHGANVNINTPLGTPLILATMEGRVENMRLLIQHGANVNTVCRKSKYGNALISSCAQGNFEAMKLLLSVKDIMVNTVVKTSKYSTALLAAIRMKNIRTTSLLLEHVSVDISVVKMARREWERSITSQTTGDRENIGGLCQSLVGLLILELVHERHIYETHTASSPSGQSGAVEPAAADDTNEEPELGNDADSDGYGSDTNSTVYTWGSEGSQDGKSEGWQSNEDSDDSQASDVLDDIDGQTEMDFSGASDTAEIAVEVEVEEEETSHFYESESVEDWDRVAETGTMCLQKLGIAMQTCTVETRWELTRAFGFSDYSAWTDLLVLAEEVEIEGASDSRIADLADANVEIGSSSEEEEEGVDEEPYMTAPEDEEPSGEGIGDWVGAISTRAGAGEQEEEEPPEEAGQGFDGEPYIPEPEPEEWVDEEQEVNDGPYLSEQEKDESEEEEGRGFDEEPYLPEPEPEEWVDEEQDVNEEPYLSEHEKDESPEEEDQGLDEEPYLPDPKTEEWLGEESHEFDEDSYLPELQGEESSGDEDEESDDESSEEEDQEYSGELYQPESGAEQWPGEGGQEYDGQSYQSEPEADESSGEEDEESDEESSEDEGQQYYGQSYQPEPGVEQWSEAADQQYYGQSYQQQPEAEVSSEEEDGDSDEDSSEDEGQQYYGEPYQPEPEAEQWSRGGGQEYYGQSYQPEMGEEESEEDEGQQYYGESYQPEMEEEEESEEEGLW